jgi:hypothetical protein
LRILAFIRFFANVYLQKNHCKTIEKRKMS